MSAVTAPPAALLPAPRPPADGDTVCVLPTLFVPEPCQWLSTTAGRVALEGYSWMQAVHWVAGSGLYKPRRHRSHGPRSLGPTTVRVAQELAQLSPCRPGIEYLVRRTGLSERTVEYHLGMLREAGLLAYVVRGTRIRGKKAQASEFARMVPPEFDAALGIRTAGEGTGRRMTGIAEAGRELMAALSKKAARKVRRRRAKSASRTSAKGARKPAEQGVGTAVSDEVRCTPMGGSSRSASSAGTTYCPSENKLASGQSESPTPKTTKRGRRKLNAVGRRFQLASELIRQVPWLGRASVPRIAWILKEVSDAGWTADQVIAFLDCGDAPDIVHRPSGFLAGRLKGAVALWPTEQGRKRAVEEYRDSRRAEKARHQEWEGDWTLPRSMAVRRLVAEALAPQQPQYELPDGHQDAGETGPEVPSEDELKELRAVAWQEFMLGRPDQVVMTLDTLGPNAAVQIYGGHLVKRVRKLISGTSLMTVGCR
ncbi:helix-turn-helix domain-containing protein [Streptomyces sp. NPDC055107]